ncbi:unnamed protein product [Meganyctiphanes norvegica]|uniref:RING-type domain-containing protein n=1 Tax=Meganyctiphanes norvegica TaxID=48144 RepID=A0AAV2SI18_MEGNR
MSSGLDEDLNCAVCCETYEETKYKPVLLPQCGHSFCCPCLLQLEVTETKFLCPTCRTPHLGHSVSKMPINYALLSISKKMLIQEQKDDFFKLSKHIKQQLKEEQESLSQRLNAIATEIMDLYEQSKILKEFINEVEENEKIARKSQDVLTLKSSLCNITHILTKFNEVTKDMSESAQSFQSTITQHIGKSDTSWPLCRIVPGCINAWPKVPWKDFMNHLPSAQLLLSPENPTVFFDLAVGEISLGRIEIQLWGHMSRAQHFLALCLGTLGPTYKDSSFDRVEKGHNRNRYLIGGYYNTNNGTTSAQGMMEDLEWGGKYDLPTRKGLVAGWSFEAPGLEATFGIVCGETFKDSLFCPFGEVSSGMNLLDNISLRECVTDVKITDCGLITLVNMV